MRRIRKSKKRSRQKQRQKQVIKINISTSSGGGGVPTQWYIPGKPIVGDTHLPNQGSINPNVPVPEPRGAVEEPEFHIAPSRRNAKPARTAPRTAPVMEKSSGDIPPMPQPPVAGEQGTPAASPPQQGGEFEATPPKTPAVSRRVEFVPSPENTAGGATWAAGGPSSAGATSLSEAEAPKSGGLRGFVKKLSPGIPVSLGTRNLGKRRGNVFAMG